MTCECSTVRSTSKTRRNILYDEKIISGLQLLCVVGPSCGWDDGKKCPHRFNIQFWSPHLKLCVRPQLGSIPSTSWP